MQEVKFSGETHNIAWSAWTTIVYQEAFRYKGDPNSGDPSIELATYASSIVDTGSGIYPAALSTKVLWAEIKAIAPQTPDFDMWVKKHPDLFDSACFESDAGWASRAIEVALKGLFPKSFGGTEVEAETTEVPAARPAE